MLFEYVVISVNNNISTDSWYKPLFYSVGAELSNMQI